MEKPRCPICGGFAEYQGFAKLRAWWKCIICYHVWDEAPAYLKDANFGK